MKRYVVEMFVRVDAENAAQAERVVADAAYDAFGENAYNIRECGWIEGGDDSDA